MTVINKLTFSVGVLALLTACNPKPAAEAPAKELDLSSEQAQLGYTIGSQMASQIQEIKDEIDVEALILAFRDSSQGKEPRLTAEQMQQAQINFQRKAQAEVEELANTNKVKSDEFLVSNGAKEGVVTTETGLQYEILREGKGEVSPTVTSSVKVHYSGTLIDGTVFDSSYDRGAPTDFPVNGVIPGFSEGLQLMKAGAKYRFFIPSDQAYGVQAPPAIGPNQALIFEVELIEVL